MKGLTAAFILAVTAMVTGCAASAPKPVTPVEADPWSDFHDGRMPAPVAKNDVKADGPALAEPAAKTAEPAPKADAVVEKTAAADMAADEPTPKAVKKKKGANHRRASQAADGSVTRKKPRKRSTSSKVVPAPPPDT